ncbi:TadE family protein [Dactylosporangium vinaceum]|nr:TadE family protein [Dactylosporangium vinaceum]
MSVELALSVPLVVLLLFLVIGALNLARANVDVHAAATAAARAGSITRSPAAASTAAQGAATANLAGHCATVAVTVDTSQFHRGGQLTVTVGCTVTTHGLTGVDVPGQITLSATSSSPVDVYRNLSLGLPSDANGAPNSGGGRS